MSENEMNKIISFKCDKVNLLSSSFCQEDPEVTTSTPKLDIDIEIDILENRFISRLKTVAHYVLRNIDPPLGQYLSFVIAGEFSCDGSQEKQQMIDVAKLYSLSILWPYAREYAGDVFRRSGFPFPILPIINPQDLTRQFIENDQIRINDLTQ